MSRSDPIATWASCSGTEALNVCSRDSLLLHSSSLKRRWWWWQGVNLCRWPVHSPLSISNSPRDSDHIVNCPFVPPVLMFYPPDLSRSEHTFCRRHETLGTVVSHSQPHSELVSGIYSVQRFRGYWSRQHLLSEWHKLLCRLFAMQSFEWRPTVSTLLAPGQNAPRMFHQPGQDWGVFSESSCVPLSTWHLMVLMAPRNNSTAFSTNPFEGSSLWTASSSVTSALQFSATRFLNATIAGSVSLFNVISVYPNELMNLATLSLAQGSSIPFFKTTLLIMF